MRRSLLVLVLLLVGTVHSSAQTINPYERLVHPESLARFDGPDGEPLHWRGGVGWPSNYTNDGYFILAQDTGAGIINHIWFNLQDKPDSACYFRIVVDDQVVFEGPMYHFFRQEGDYFRPPFDTVMSGGLVLDEQIPFRHNFRLDFRMSFDYCCLFWAIGWRPVSDSNLVESWNTHSARSLSELAEAERLFWNGGSPWAGRQQESLAQSATLNPGDTMQVADLSGSGIIEELHFDPSTYDSTILRNVQVQMYWEENEHPAVVAPLGDIFGFGTGVRNVRSYYVRATESTGFTCYYPMPFATHAKIRIVNLSAQPITLGSSLKYETKAIDRKTYGYFHAAFTEENPTVWPFNHSILHTRGRGRLVELQLSAPDHPAPFFLEGDPLFTIDSDLGKWINYTGTEDFYNGGWFFADGPFSLPFAGATDLWNSFYRLLILDAVDYDRSLDLNMEHGADNKYPAWFRTLAFYYQLPVSFWRSADTLRSGQTLRVSGTGYAPNAPITVAINGQPRQRGVADAEGRFAVWMSMNDGPGAYLVDVNGEQDPNPLKVVAAPIIHSLGVTQQHLVYQDSLTIRGVGFEPGEKVSIYFDTALATAPNAIRVDSSYGFTCKIYLPWLPSGHYYVRAVGDHGSSATTDSTYNFTRNRNYEFENYWPPEALNDYSEVDYMGYSPDHLWSNNFFVLLKPSAPSGKYITFRIYMPIGDTYEPVFFGTKGVRFGIYNISVDNEKLATFDGYEKRDWGDPIRSDSIFCSPLYLSRGYHEIRLDEIGAEDSAIERGIGADNIVFVPLTPFHPLENSVRPDSSSPTGGPGNPPGGDPTGDPSSLTEGIDLLVFPNPITSKQMHVVVSLPLAVRQDQEIDLSIYDVTGRLLHRIYHGTPFLRSFALDEPIDDLANGTYYCRFTFTDKGIVRSVTRSIVIDR